MRVLLTGGSGFLGAWIVRRLAARGAAMRVLDVSDRRDIVADIAGSEAAAAIDWCVADVCDGDAVQRAAKGCDAVIHLAGMLTPACRDDPVRGAAVNLVGTLNVFEAALAHGLRSVVYASSAAVFGPDDPVQPYPVTQYGAFKLACEGSARSYWIDRRLPSVGFRPLVVYGPGREVGISAGPSLACRAAARGEPYQHPFSGRTGLVYVDDCAALFEQALDRAPRGAEVYNVIGDMVAIDELLAEIRRVVPDARLTVSGPPLPVASGIGEPGLDEAFPSRPRTSLADGVRATIAHYRR